MLSIHCDAALARSAADQIADTHGAADLSLFPAYVKLLYSMSRANAELADKKARIMGKITALSDAVTLIYIRGARSDPPLLCAAIDTLHTATSDALLWSVAGIDAASTSSIYAVTVELALTNVSASANVMLRPNARMTVEYDNQSLGELDVETVGLGETELLDNNIPPGFTRVRSYAGVATRAVIQGCQLDAQLVVDGRTLELTVPISTCGANDDPIDDELD